MIKIKSVSIQNFLSYGAVPTVIDLDCGGTTLIIGEDLDNTASGVGANGVGKTVWLNALIYGLYGKPISNIKSDNLVNNINNKHLEVIVTFIKDDKVYTVKRVRKEKGLGNYAKVYCHGIKEQLNTDKHDVTPDSIKNIDDFVERALCIPFELFVRIVAFSATHTPFLDLPVRHASQANQSDIMEELFRLNRLSEKADLLKEEIKNTKQSLDIKQRHNEQLEVENTRHNDQIASAHARVTEWAEKNAMEITQATTDVRDFEDADVDGQLKLFADLEKIQTKQDDLLDKVVDFNTNIHTNEISRDGSVQELNLREENNKDIREKFKQWEIDTALAIENYDEAKQELVSRETLDKQLELHNVMRGLSDDRDILITCTKDIDTKINDSLQNIADAEEELSHLLDAKCPYCLQKYENTKSKIKKCKETLAFSNKNLKENNKSKVAYDEAFVTVDKEIAATREKITHHPEEIEAENRLRDDLIKAMADLDGVKNPHIEQEAAIDETRTYEIQKDIENFEKNIQKETENRDIYKVDAAALDDDILKIKNKIEFATLDLVYTAKNQLEIAAGKLKTLQSSENPHMEALLELQNVMIEAVDMDSVNTLDKLLTHQNYLLKLLTKKDSFIRKNLLSKNLIFLNQRLKGYLSDLGLPHRVEFTQEMTAKISQFGHELDFGNLSSGQKARVNLALSFSFRDVLQRSLDSVNVCMLDEVLDVGLDGVGVQNAARMLKRKSRDDGLTLFIISHRDEVSGIFDKKLIVQMSRGFSNIRMEE